MKLKLFGIAFLCLYLNVATVEGQETAVDSVDTRFNFSGDFRFRLEYDWNSRKSDGTYRKDRTRLRYRFRFGFTKNLDRHFQVGARLRTGNINDQQGPHLTLGGNQAEFGLAQIGFEKIYLQYKRKHFWSWIGKNSYPFWKQNELLWNDNVMPEGVAVGLKAIGNKNMSISPTLGHFIFKSSNSTFDVDAYLTSFQVASNIHLDENRKIQLNIGNLYFHQMPDIPDNQSTYLMDYHIITGSLNYQFPIKNKPISLGFDAFVNTLNYDDHEEVAPELATEKVGYVLNIKYGKLSQKGDYTFHLYYAHIGEYAVVDYLAQNDWARWDYSSYGASASRLSNFKGIELRAGYNITSRINLIARYYKVGQIINMGQFKENGDRFRIDLNAKF